MITSKAVIDWMIERLAECHREFPTGLPPAPRFIDSNGEEYPVFHIVKREGKEEELEIGSTNLPFLTYLPLKIITLKRDRSALVLA